MKGLLALGVTAVIAVAGCAAHRIETPAAVPKTTPEKVSNRPVVEEKKPVVVPGEGKVEAEPVAPPAAAAAPTAAAATPPAPPRGDAPPATESAYVFSPQQATTAHPSAASVPAAAAPPPQTSPAPAAEDAPHDPEPATPGELHLAVIASAAEIGMGGIMTVDVMASSNTAVVDAPLHLTFDPSVVEFVDGTPGDFLSQGGSSVVFFADGKSRPGDVAVAAGRVERASGATGSGLLCRVRFRGTSVGTSPVLVGRAKAWGVRGEELAVSGEGTNVVVR